MKVIEEKAVQEPLKYFIKGLEKLYKECGVYVQGCGCCGSPWLYSESENKRGCYYLTFENEKYEFSD